MEKEYKEILSFWVRHTDDKKQYFRIDWKHMISTIVKYMLKGYKIYFTVVKHCSCEEYHVQFLIKNKIKK